MLGPEPGDHRTMRCLNRVLRWQDADEHGCERIEYEADQRHAEIIQSQHGLKANSKGVTTPGVNEKLKPSDLFPIPERDVRPFRSVCMRCNYLAQNRPEL